MLIFIGLGLYDHTDISIKGLNEIKAADYIFLENYTSVLTGTDHKTLSEFYGKTITVLKREDVEQDPELILKSAESGTAVFLTGGDPMVSTTHTDLRIRAKNRGIKTRIIHGSSIVSAVCGLCGLQNYRFGKSCSIPYPTKNWFPKTPIEVIALNQRQNLHTLVYLDIQIDRYMSIADAIRIVKKLALEESVSIPLYIGIARAGSDDPKIVAGSSKQLLTVTFGPPLHILVIPGRLHEMEEEYLKEFAGYEPS